MQDTGYFSLSVSIAPHPHKNTSHYIIEGEVVNWLVEQKKISELFLLALPNFFFTLFFTSLSIIFEIRRADAALFSQYSKKKFLIF